METATNKREDILEAALVLFAERGFDATTIPMIATKANVGAGTIYRYFVNKETLMNQLFREYVTRFLETLRNGYPDNGTCRQQFSHIFNSMVRFTLDNEHALYFIKTHNRPRVLDEESLALYQELLDFTRDFFEEGIEMGKIRRMPANALIAIVFGAFIQLHQLVREGAVEETIELLRDYEESCWDAVRAHE
ncbi:TetR/AcrR family transcriptional regulator [Pontibacillus salipaludis]|uniref:TetR/AcrR family transcriptional regulator n=1 Tax=Pontibacillus salipaludis TaxID=1697394 RepID=UPI0031ED8C1B